MDKCEYSWFVAFSLISAVSLETDAALIIIFYKNKFSSKSNLLNKYQKNLNDFIEMYNQKDDITETCYFMFILYKKNGL
jgi:hypothetical protein